MSVLTLLDLLTRVSFFAFSCILLLRAQRGRYLARFPLFYSFVAFSLLSGAAAQVVKPLDPALFPSAFWFQYLAIQIAEFGVLAEFSDHLLDSYPVLRSMGRGVILALTAALLVFFIVPVFFQEQSTSLAILALSKRGMIAKAILIAVLFLGARYYRLHLSRNTSGMIAGFAAYVAINIVNFQLAAVLGREAYATTFSLVGPLSYVLCYGIWTVVMWKYEPAPMSIQVERGTGEADSAARELQLRRLNTALARLLRR